MYCEGLGAYPNSGLFEQIATIRYYLLFVCAINYVCYYRYETGDDEMKRMISKAWYEGQHKKKDSTIDL